jgi:uncharacterized membrane protein YdjX (TVP38/TMEM64 family)
MDKTIQAIKRRRLRIILSIGLLVLLTLAIRISDAVDLGAIADYVDDSGSIGVIVFGLVYFGLILIGVSTAALTVIAGTLFGIITAMVVVVASATLSAAAAFMIARHAKHLLYKKTVGTTSELGIVQRIDRAAKHNGFSAVAVMRLSFLPYIPVSYGAGFVRNLRFRDFIWATFVTNILRSFVFIFLGASFRESFPIFLVAIGVVVGYVLLSKKLRRKVISR